MKEVDIIIAAKNVGPYIYDCLASCTSNTNHLVSHIHVTDDGSDDHTSSEIDRFIAERGSSITRVKAAGIGPARARNEALQNTKSEFVAFVDGDDLISAEALSRIIHQMNALNAELACPRITAFDHFGMFQYEHDRPDLKAQILDHKPFYLTNSFDFPQLFDLETSMCMRVFRRSLLENHAIAFQDLMFCEDVYPSRVALIQSKRILLTNEYYYYYRCNRPHQRTSTVEKSTIDIIDSARESINVALNNDLTPAQGGWYTTRICRMILWGTQLIPVDHLDEYASAAADTLAKIPASWWSQLTHIMPHDSWVHKVAFLHLDDRSPKSRQRIIYLNRYRFADRLISKAKETRKKLKLTK